MPFQTVAAYRSSTRTVSQALVAAKSGASKRHMAATWNPIEDEAVSLHGRYFGPAGLVLVLALNFPMLLFLHLHALRTCTCTTSAPHQTTLEPWTNLGHQPSGFFKIFCLLVSVSVRLSTNNIPVCQTNGRVAVLVHASYSSSTAKGEEQLADQDDPAAPPRKRRPSILPGQIIDLAQRTPLLAAWKRTSLNARPRASSDKRDGWKATGWLTPPHGRVVVEAAGECTDRQSCTPLALKRHPSIPILCVSRLGHYSVICPDNLWNPGTNNIGYNKVHGLVLLRTRYSANCHHCLS
ncbi:hypothetical protein GGI42DRAFT_215887 [Trichoderma sp. SZMC 28013]